MFKKVSMSIAVAALISSSGASRLRMSHRTDFVDESLDDDELAMTKQSISESEQVHKSKLGIGEGLVHQALVQNNRLNFDDKGDTFEKVFKIKDSYEAEGTKHFPGVTFVQQGSDPIHGSGGRTGVAKFEDLTPEQQFEHMQRNTKAADLKDEYDTVDVTANSIKKAEALVGAKFPEPTDPKQKAKVKPPVEYHLHDSDEEDEDTVETRRSVKTVEKRMKHRFFINAHEQRQYQADAAAGKISAKELEFAEGEDEEIGGDPNVAAQKEKAKKEGLKTKKADKKKEEEKKEKEKKEEKEEKAKAEKPKQTGDEAAATAQPEPAKEAAAKEPSAEPAGPAGIPELTGGPAGIPELTAGIPELQAKKGAAAGATGAGAAAKEAAAASEPAADAAPNPFAGIPELTAPS